jgi:hypothetical protein
MYAGRFMSRVVVVSGMGREESQERDVRSESRYISGIFQS